MKKLLFIINPVAGRRQYRRFLADIIRVFSEKGYMVTVYLTEKAGDATAVSRELCGEYELLVCLGGDGTLNEIINGVISSGKNIPIGYIPAGSTNDFANSLDIEEDLLSAAEDIVDGAERRVDAVSFGGRGFINIAAFGIFTSMGYNTPQNMKNLLGGFAYILGGAQDLANLRTYHIRLRAGERAYDEKFLFGAVCNASSMGGAFSLPNGAEKPDDGLYEVLLIRKPEKFLELQRLIVSLVTGVYNSPYIEFFKTDSLVIEESEDIVWLLDGEKFIPSAPAEIRLLPSRLCFRVGRREKKQGLFRNNPLALNRFAGEPGENRFGLRGRSPFAVTEEEEPEYGTETE